jgi:acylphosphatase
MNRRWNIHFSGHVQGVGFRYQTHLLAQRYEVVGWVANLDNGQVRLLVEGKPSELAIFLRDLQEKMAGYIGDVEIQKGPASGEFNRFEIRVG